MGARPTLLVLFAAALFAAPPQVNRVEPPNWWAGHSINPVRVLVHGSGLHGARVESPFETGRLATNAAGTYLFVDVAIPANAKPGAYPLKVKTAEGVAEIPFEIAPALDAANRFQGFSPDDVIYLIMPDRFANGDTSNDDPPKSKGLFDRSKKRYYHGGDLQGVIDKLPYLQSLGITAIWLNPIYDNNDRINDKERYDNEPITDYHGYGAVDFYAVDEHLGDIRKFRELVDAAHKRGIKIIQDQVANHTGPRHPWVKDTPTQTWFNGTEAKHLDETWQTWTLMDPNATYAAQRETLEGWFINLLPDLNQNDPETRRYLIQNTLWWIGMTGLDAIRQDTLPYVPRDFWRDWMAAIKRQYPWVRVVGEVMDGDPALVSFFQGGRAQFDGVDSRVDSVFDFPLFYPIRRAFAQGKPVREVAAMLAHDRLYTDPAMLVTTLGLHDLTRFMNEDGASIAGLKLAFSCLMTVRGVPMIYYGDEIGMPGGNDPDNRRDFPGGWPGDPRNAFDKSGRTPDEQAVFEHVQKLTRLRAENESLRRGVTRNLVVNEQTWAFERTAAGKSVIVVFNNAASAQRVSFALDRSGAWKDALGVAPALTAAHGAASVTMPARTAAIYVLP